MDLTQLKSFGKLYPMFIKRYETFLPTDDAAIIARMNSIIENMNRVGMLTNDVVHNWNLVLEWAMGDGLNKAIDDKVEKMVLDGTFDQIINSNVFGDINNHLTRIDSSLAEKTSFDITKETILFTSFNGINGTELDLYVSQDGVNLIPLHTNSLFRYTQYQAKPVTRDISIIFYNNYYYLTFGTKDSAGLDVIGIARTKDFLNYESWHISVDTQYTRIYAPQWFLDGSNVYVITSLCVNEQKDANGIDPYLSTYYHKATDLTDLKSFAIPVKVTYPTDENRVDAAIYKINGVYHQFVKHEIVGETRHYTFSGSSIEGASWTYLQNIDFTMGDDNRAEGYALAYFNNQYWLYADQYARNKTLVVTSTDLQNWSPAQYVNNPANLRTKHFDCLVLNDSQKQDIVNFVFKNQVNQITDFTKRTLYPHYQNVVYLKNYVSGTKFTPDVNLSGKTLYLIDQPITIDNISVPIHNGYFIPKNRYHLSELYFCVFNNSTLTINYNSANNTGDNNYILTPSLQSLVLTGNNGNTENILILKKAVETDSFYRVLNSGNFAYAFNQLYNTNQSAYNQIDLNTLAVGGVISNLVLADNTVYYYSGASTITINAVDVSALNRIRSTVWFSIMNNTTGPSLTLKSSATIITPGDVDFVISKANGNNERLIPWTRYASSTLRPKF